ncbi:MULTISPECIES: alpha/beta fold hydrolase [unclassified Sphingopyxis]|uniref:alpha/beta fold hydrolase n=1 Tax=unclassified Sphingopyxis TaxID=2614943 RepID=UPI00073624C4|nr:MULTISPECIES: alpha/beta hydrolase [unclassified Sphingopyxis]KTE32601.1 alpha/beta hydrolase [Sphingopyxis sp. HIX]KTE83375.1 alpha/beta hydrolase [Sphingopyxis sp. HXXIV]
MAQPREHRLATPDGDLCWFEWGARSQRPSVLLLHATGFHARLWDQVVAALPTDTHVVAPDSLGHGRSAKPAAPFDWAKTADFLLPLVDRFAGTPLVGCGHSMGGYLLTRLAAERPAAFKHLFLIDPVIMDPAFYADAVGQPLPDPAEHPVARRRARWEAWEAMRAHFGKRPPYMHWDPVVLADYCRHGLLPAADGEGYELACPPAVEASVYLSALRTNPHDWFAGIAAPVSVIRAQTGERAGALDFSVSPTWPALGAKLGAVRDEQWGERSHFIPMEAPQRLADLIAAAL